MVAKYAVRVRYLEGPLKRGEAQHKFIVVSSGNGKVSAIKGCPLNGGVRKKRFH